MNINDAFPSQYLKSSDIKGKDPVLTIERVELADVGDKSRLVVYFRNAKKGLVLNKTNATSIEEITGESDTDKWTGKRVKLIVVKTEYQGRRVDGIRIDEPAAAKPAPVATKIDDDEDSIPF